MKEPARPRVSRAGERQDERIRPAAACFRSLVAGILVVFLAVPLSEAAEAVQNAPQEQAEALPPAPAVSQDPPDAPAPVAAQADAGQQPAQQNPAAQQQGTPPSLGTAAAPVENPVGIPGSKPAGAVIAPAKQKRTRSFAIRIAILVGAVVGVGTVVALSNASPSRPH